MRLLLCLLCTVCLSAVARAGVEVQPLPGNQFILRWNGKDVTLAGKPELRRLGAGAREWFDPNSRKYVKIDTPAGQDGFLTVLNKARQKVFLGEPKVTLTTAAGKGIVYRTDYPAARTWWQVTVTPVEDNGFDLALEVGTAPMYWLADFDINLLTLNLDGALIDSGAVPSWFRPQKSLAALGPLKGDISICYPNGPNCFVPAGIMQDKNFALGLCLLGAHEQMLTDHSELSVRSAGAGKGYSISLRSAENPFYGRRFEQHFSKRYRFRLADPRPLGDKTYVRLLDYKDLWIDYMKELDREVPARSAPARDPAKNNIILMNFFMAESHLVTERNPMGWLMNDPAWKKNPWEWTVKPEMDEAAVRKVTGFGPENFGKPVKWIKAYADKCVKDLKAGNCLAMVTWASAVVSDMYAPESHLFNPDLEETNPVEGEVRSWDWVEAQIEVKTAAGEVVAQKTGALIRAYNPEKLLQVDQFSRPFGAEQRLKLLKTDIAPAGVKYLEKAGGRSNKDRHVDNVALILKVKAARDVLLGRKPGESVQVAAEIISDDPAFARQPVTIEAKITGVRRAAIDIWAQTLIDAQQEFGFLVREDFTVGMPWNQWCQRFDWSADWQYKMLKQRFEWHLDRFGKSCRWFYLDVFGNYTPQFVFEMLRADFPDCFFFAEHPNDGVLRTIQGWNWEGPMNELERYVAPNGLVTILPERFFAGKWSWAHGAFSDADKTTMKSLWRDPNCIFVVHRSVRDLVRRAAESGCDAHLAPEAAAGESAPGALNPDGTIKTDEK